MELISRENRKDNIIFFGTDGIRGKAETLFTNELLQKLGFLSDQVLPKKKPILIGQDSRLSSQRIANELADGLMASGREVWLLGLCPTPAVAFLIRKNHAAGGFMISASHNPPEDNGIKIFDSNGEKLSSQKQSLIEKGLQAKKTIRSNTRKNCICRYDLLKEYEKSLIQSIPIDDFEGASIVLDLCWGSATACGENLFRSLGAKVTCINAKPNGRKINVNCGSTHLEDIKKAVLETNSEMGFAFDGDADRMIAIDGRGRVVDGDNILYLWGSELKEKNALPEQRLVATVMSNLGFEKAWVDQGGILERAAVGDQNVRKVMVEKKAILGGEQSGHILSTLNGLSGDGLLTALQLSNICKKKALRLEDLFDQSFKAFPQKLINVPVSPIFSQQSLIQSEKFQASIKKAEQEMGGGGRVFVRKSGTESILRVMVESIDESIVEFWSSTISNIASEEFN